MQPSPVLQDHTIITQLSLCSTEGFRPSDVERSRLSSIDSRLKSLAPYEHCEQFAYLNESNLMSEVSKIGLRRLKVYGFKIVEVGNLTSMYVSFNK